LGFTLFEQLTLDSVSLTRFALPGDRGKLDDTSSDFGKSSAFGDSALVASCPGASVSFEGDIAASFEGDACGAVSPLEATVSSTLGAGISFGSSAAFAGDEAITSVVVTFTGDPGVDFFAGDPFGDILSGEITDSAVVDS